MKGTISLLVAALLLMVSCQPAGESVVGSSSDTEIPNVTFQIDTTYVVGSPASLVAKGKARNGGSATISSPWYVEAQFYTDASFTTKLGGNYTQIGVPLSNGQQTLWTISFSSSSIDVRQYPNFRVRDLRAIYKK